MYFFQYSGFPLFYKGRCGKSDKIHFENDGVFDRESRHGPSHFTGELCYNVSKGNFGDTTEPQLANTPAMGLSPAGHR